LPINEATYTPAKELASIIYRYVKLHHKKQKKTVNLIDMLLNSQYSFKIVGNMPGTRTMFSEILESKAFPHTQ